MGHDPEFPGGQPSGADDGMPEHGIPEPGPHEFGVDHFGGDDPVLGGPEWAGDHLDFGADHEFGVDHPELGAEHWEFVHEHDAEAGGAGPAELSFVDDYAGGHHLDSDPGLEWPAPAGPEAHMPIGYDELWGDLPGDRLHEIAADAGVPFGADPDLGADSGLYAFADHGEAFPPLLEWDTPEPIDGYPWIDPGLLGHDTAYHSLPDSEAVAGYPDEVGGVPHPDELFEYAGEQPVDGDAWSWLAASADPATSALARWWSTGRVV